MFLIDRSSGFSRSKPAKARPGSTLPIAGTGVVGEVRMGMEFVPPG
jgi:hypothetical protein